MSQNNLKKLHQEHVVLAKKYADECMAELGYEQIVIYAGDPYMYHADDQSAPFRPVPQFAYWCPDAHPQHAVILRPGSKPVLCFYAPDDFWHEPAKLDDPYWAESFDVKEVSSLMAIHSFIEPDFKTAFIGRGEDKFHNFNMDVNPEALVTMFDWGRSFKTEYEIQCLSEAQRLGAIAHTAAKEAFFAGKSELGIYQSYMNSIDAQESELPYGAIIALNEKGAYLHYEDKRREPNGQVLLIDAGARYEAFGSDITRTYATEETPEEFRSLIAGVEELQLELCDLVKPGSTVGDLHHASHVKIAELLIKIGVILDCSVDQAIEDGLTRVFYPHGIGHLLGIQVHDVAGQISDRKGTPSAPHPRHPKLRTTRDMEPGMVITVEPGIYFIGMLLDPLRTGELSSKINWDLVDRLMPCGGIRIEDDVLVTESGHRNLTREHLPK